LRFPIASIVNRCDMCSVDQSKRTTLKQLAGTAVVGTLVAVLVTTQLPGGVWGADLVQHFFHGERITYLVLAALVGLVATFGSLTLTDSHATAEPEEQPEETAPTSAGARA
jgi:hypothetical protein